MDVQLSTLVFNK